MNTINLRINYLAENYFNGNNVKFANSVESSEANIRNYRKNGVPKLDFIVKTCEFLNINTEWLITGTGEMLRNTENQPLQSVATPQIEKNNEKDNYIIELQKKTIERLEIDLQKCCEEKKALQTGNNVFNK